MGMTGQNACIILLRDIIRAAQSDNYILSLVRYHLIGRINLTLSREGTDNEKKAYCYLLYQAREQEAQVSQSQYFAKLELHFRQLCAPLLNKLEDFVPRSSSFDDSPSLSR
jgi:hypothetical protein